MQEILHHLECIKPCKQWDKLTIKWCRIFPSTVSPHVSAAWMLLHARSDSTEMTTYTFCFSLFIQLSDVHPAQSKPITNRLPLMLIHLCIWVNVIQTNFVNWKSENWLIESETSLSWKIWTVVADQLVRVFCCESMDLAEGLVYLALFV